MRKTVTAEFWLCVAAVSILAGCGKDAGPEDLTPPDAIADLHVLETLPTEIVLAWTATGDDGGEGTATGYDVRHSSEEILESTWDTAVQIDGEPAPQPAGSPETMTINELLPDTEYHVAIRTFDEAGNGSDLTELGVRTGEEGAPPPAFDFEYLGVDEQIHHLSDDSGSVILLNFWATWCRPCQTEMPFLQLLQNEYRTNGLVVIGISVDGAQTQDKVPAFLENHGISYSNGYEPDDLPTVYHRDGIPSNYIIGRGFQVADHWVGYTSQDENEIRQRIEAVLDQD